MTCVINGIKAAEELRSSLVPVIGELRERGIIPKLAVVLVGDNQASQIYVRNKKAKAQEVGILSEDVLLAADISPTELSRQIQRLNNDPKVHAILVQLPLPAHLDALEVISWIDPKKDVDCFHPYNVGLMSYGKEIVAPCTPAGIVHLIQSVVPSISGKHAVVIGRSNVVGRPMAQLLLNKDCSVTIVHSRTANLAEMCSQADILVAAVGKEGLVTRHFVKHGAIVIDVGINRSANGQIAGDVNSEDIMGIADFVTPVPGGVGPMTIAYLLHNAVVLAKKFGS